MQERWLLKPSAETFGLGVIERTRDDGKRFVLYVLPDVVMMIPLLKNGNIVKIEEMGNRPHKLGKSYFNFPGETFEPSEQEEYNRLRRLPESHGEEIKDFVCGIARRGLLEEIGTKADRLEYLGNILENTGRSERIIHFVLAEGCERMKANEEGISSSAATPREFWTRLTEYLKTDLASPHGGSNTLKAFVFAANRLNWWPQLV